MKRSLFVLFFGLLILVDGARGEFRAGISVRNVTPDPLLPVSGGVGPSKPTVKKEGELQVRALVFEDGLTRVAFVSADFLGFPATLGNRVRAKVKGILPKNILIGATHTHSAPDCYGFPDGKGEPPPIRNTTLGSATLWPRQSTKRLPNSNQPLSKSKAAKPRGRSPSTIMPNNSTILGAT